MAGKKKTLKQQDFRKAKLKVGKAKQLPSNVTNTSFVARTITLPNQGKIGARGNTPRNIESDVLKRLSLCKHHSAVTRKETLIYFKQIIPRVIGTKTITPMLNSIVPLMCDEDSNVRDMLVELIDEIGSHDSNVLRLHCRALTLFISSGMTHITTAVQRDSGKFLRVVTKHCGDELVRGSWVKMLKGMFGVLGWSLEENKKKSISMSINSSSVVSINSNKTKKYRSMNLETLVEFIKCGCIEEKIDENEQEETMFSRYLVPEYPQPYAYLKLFTKEFKNNKSNDSANKTTATFKLDELNNISCEDFVTRRKILVENFYDKIVPQLQATIKDGGDCGRSANTLQVLLEEIKTLHHEA